MPYDEINAAKIPFLSDVYESQKLTTEINSKVFELKLTYNSRGFFVIRATHNNIIYCNQKLTDVPVIGRNPSTYLPEFMIMPVNSTVDDLEVWIVAARQL